MKIDSEPIRAHVDMEQHSQRGQLMNDINSSFGRVCFAILVWTAMLIGLTEVGATLFGFYGTIAGVVLWFVAMAFATSPFLVSVPEVTGLVTVNVISGLLRPYGPGLHFRYPWEQVKTGNYINIRIITQQFGFAGAAETYPAEDGPEMLVKWSFQYRATIGGLPQYIAVDKTTIDTGLREIGSSYLSKEIKGRKAEDIRGGTGKEDLQNGLRAHFDKPHTVMLNGKLVENTLDKLYGIEMILASLADVDFSKRYQDSRETKRVTEKLAEAADTLITRGMSGEDAFKKVLVVDGKAALNIHDVGEALGKAVQAGIATIIGKMGK